GSANALRDQRDAVLGQLSKLMNIKTVADGGVINVYVGSAPLVMAAQNRGVALRQDNLAGKLTSTVIFKADNSAIDVGASGQIGALSDLRANQIGAAMDKVDTLAGNLIFSLNKVYSSGQGLRGFSTVTATNQVDDPTVALNDPTANLAFKPVNGSFVVHVKAKGANITTSTLVQVDLDGLNGNDTTLNSLAASLNSIPDISASVIGGKLQINGGSPDIDLSFSQDSSGVLASLGINSFFTGTTARDIAVNSIVQANPVLLAASKNSEPGDNQTALAIAGLESQPVEALNGASLKDNYQSIINGIAVSAASAKTNAEATKAVQDTLSAQRESLSGVSLDEEAVNLMRQQRAFQGAARLISAVDEMMKTLLSM
ncbi:MAG TPA: flagellar basal body rod C-terminal domain-containing protein, partial [Tepidisphaeraceae bacterium]